MAAPHPLLVPLITGEPFPPDARIDMDVVISAEEHGVAALIDATWKARSIELDDGVAKRLTMSTLAAAAENKAALRALSTIQDVARDLGIQVAVFKGVAIGSRFYPDPLRRPTVDLDVFVAPEHVGNLGALVTTLGQTPAHGLAIDAMVAEGRVFEHSIVVDGTLVDLHRDPMNMVLPSTDEQARWDRTEVIAVADGLEVRTLDLEDSVIQAALHLFRDNFADLLHANDLRRMIEAGPDWAEVERRSAVNGWTDLVRYAVWAAADAFGVASPLPTTIRRWRRTAIDTVWRPSLRFQGHRSHATSLRRQSALSLLTAASPVALGSAFAARVAPPRQVIALRSGNASGPYPVALGRWRLGQRRDAAAFKRAGDRRTA